ncbi:hypothetical protein [Crocosphaera sp. Alani8]|uniref:hypothetical protein n=1 Tax=Crocosphaera sp. Alani8 TaxID=3038952 RepID=UPI00313BA9F2
MLLNRLFRGLGVFPVSGGLLLLTVPVAVAGNWNQYSVCVTQLQKFDVSGEDAAIACSDALIPKELSECVSMIGNATPIDGNDSLRACFQVRRPIDLGNCVADIYNAVPDLAEVDPETDTEEINLLTLLNSCRTSSRPGFYSECVIAAANETDEMNPIRAMDVCLSAQDFPRDLFPAYNE